MLPSTYAIFPGLWKQQHLAVFGLTIADLHTSIFDTCMQAMLCAAHDISDLDMQSDHLHFCGHYLDGKHAPDAMPMINAPFFVAIAVFQEHAFLLYILQ